MFQLDGQRTRGRRGITASGKSSSTQLLVNQILRLSTHSKKEAKLAEQIKSLSTLLDSFGNAKTLINPNASRHSRYLELHFNDRGRIQAAKVLTYGLDKSRLSRLSFEERTYHVKFLPVPGRMCRTTRCLHRQDATGCLQDRSAMTGSQCHEDSRLQAETPLVYFRPPRGDSPPGEPSVRGSGRSGRFRVCRFWIR